MAKKKKIFFPSKDGEVPAHVSTADGQLNAGGLGVKYGISATDMTKSGDFNTDIPVAINDAEAAINAAQSKVETKDNMIYDANLFYNKMGRDMQDHSAYDPADLEAMGFFKTTTPPDPNAAKPVVSKITALADMIILDWVKSFWDGVVIYGSFDQLAWEKLDKDNRSPYEDKRKNKVNNVPEVRYYKFRYLKDDKEIGLELIVKAVAEIY